MCHLLIQHHRLLPHPPRAAPSGRCTESASSCGAPLPAQSWYLHPLHPINPPGMSSYAHVPPSPQALHSMREQLRLPSLKVHPAVKVKEGAGGGKDGKDGGKEAKGAPKAGEGGRDPAGSYRVLEACSTEAAADDYCAAREALIIYVNRCASRVGVGAGTWGCEGKVVRNGCAFNYRKHLDPECGLCVAHPAKR